MTETTHAGADGLPLSAPQRKLKQSRRLSLGAWVGLTLALLVIAVAIFGPFFAPHDPDDSPASPLTLEAPSTLSVSITLAAMRSVASCGEAAQRSCLRSWERFLGSSWG